MPSLAKKGLIKHRLRKIHEIFQTNFPLLQPMALYQVNYSEQASLTYFSFYVGHYQEDFFANQILFYIRDIPLGQHLTKHLL